MLGYFELPEEDIPDASIWHDAARLEEWFAVIRQKHQSGPGMEPVPEADDAEMTGNELSAELMERIGR